MNYSIRLLFSISDMYDATEQESFEDEEENEKEQGQEEQSHSIRVSFSITKVSLR
jgi:hypothetical protein